MFTYDNIYIVKNPVGEIVGVFKRKDNALESIPERARNRPKQISEKQWEYGETKKWSITFMRILDSNDLPYVAPRK